MEVKVLFSRADQFCEPRGFDVEGILIEIGDGKISSQGSSQNLMLIYMAIPGLIFGFFLELSGARGAWNFVGADSSFSVNFKSKGKWLEVLWKKGEDYLRQS